jgi:hypothetical protein
MKGGGLVTFVINQSISFSNFANLQTMLAVTRTT